MRMTRGTGACRQAQRARATCVTRVQTAGPCAWHIVSQKSGRKCKWESGTRGGGGDGRFSRSTDEVSMLGAPVARPRAGRRQGVRGGCGGWPIGETGASPLSYAGGLTSSVPRWEPTWTDSHCGSMLSVQVSSRQGSGKLSFDVQHLRVCAGTRAATISEGHTHTHEPRRETRQAAALPLLDLVDPFGSCLRSHAKSPSRHAHPGLDPAIAPPRSTPRHPPVDSSNSAIVAPARTALFPPRLAPRCLHGLESPYGTCLVHHSHVAEGVQACGA